jgi:hypothetical protein
MAQILIQQHAQHHPSAQVQRNTDLKQTRAMREVQVNEYASPQQRNGYNYGMHELVNAQDLADWTTDTDSLTGWMTPSNTNTTLIGLSLTNPLERQLQQRMTKRGVLFAKHLRAEIAHDIRFRAASAL